MLGKLFPALRIARIDRDTTARRSVFEKSLFDFSEVAPHACITGKAYSLQHSSLQVHKNTLQ